MIYDVLAKSFLQSMVYHQMIVTPIGIQFQYFDNVVPSIINENGLINLLNIKMKF